MEEARGGAVGDGQLAGRPNPGSKAERQHTRQNEQKVLAFKVAHILISILFVFFMYVAQNTKESRVLTAVDLYNYSDCSCLPKAFF